MSRWVKIADHLYIGAIDAVNDAQFMKEANIKAVINISGQTDIGITHVEQHYYPFEDKEVKPSELVQYFDGIQNILGMMMILQRAKYNTIVVSKNFVNRAQAVTLAYYIYTHEISAQEAEDKLKGLLAERGISGPFLTNASLRRALWLAQKN